jgi:hypothetical protein
MDRIQECADKSIRRWCAFGLLSTALIMVAMAADVHLAIRDGALTAMLLWVFLCLKALRAPTTDYRETETWNLLDRKSPETVPVIRLQTAIGGTLRDRYLWHADLSAALAFILWTVSFGLKLA